MEAGSLPGNGHGRPATQTTLLYQTALCRSLCSCWHEPAPRRLFDGGRGKGIMPSMRRCLVALAPGRVAAAASATHACRLGCRPPGSRQRGKPSLQRLVRAWMARTGGAGVGCAQRASVAGLQRRRLPRPVDRRQGGFVGRGGGHLRIDGDGALRTSGDWALRTNGVWALRTDGNWASADGRQLEQRRDAGMHAQRPDARNEGTARRPQRRPPVAEEEIGRCAVFSWRAPTWRAGQPYSCRDEAIALL